MSNSGNQYPPAPSADGEKVFKGRGIQIFGMGLQDVIRVFFSGNASLAVIILILICFFLAKEAFLFFPDHHKDLKSYRESGQEFVGFISEEVKAHTDLYSVANIAYYAEVNRTSREEDTILRAYRTVLANVENRSSKTWKRLERELDSLEDIVDDLEDLDEEKEEDQAEFAKLTKEKNRLEAVIEPLREKLGNEVNTIIDWDEIWNFGVGADEPVEEDKEKIREAVLFEAYPDAEDDHPFIEETKKISREKKAAAAQQLVSYRETTKAMQAAVRPLKNLERELKEPAEDNKKEITSFSTAPQRRDAWLKGAEVTDDPDEKARMRAKAEEVVIEGPEYAKINQVFYDSVARQAAIAAPLEVEMKKLFDQLPNPAEVETKSAKENLKRATVFYDRFEAQMAFNQKQIKEWRHDKPISVPESVSAFLFGRDWTTNSSWHDFYGLLPLFTGSLLISMIALAVAVPFSIAAAVYVNQLASSREQSLVKPAIEFIGAIPSVVLGFFGILVFGEALRNLSQLEWLQWFPGFPMAERLTILNAGLLLAFMAAPTIFTLTEDALNNVPQAFTENSLAMGATKLQTVFRVVVPTSLSGIIAAVLLGFGRIIGETMVVLLVAGNKIKIPDFTEGLGVVTQPAHTMTGIIAQELGEVDSGSLHWRALFMVGMVLFVISLLVNFTAQKVLKKFQRI
ncbi:phosphate ABC transporter permease subunit PstC [Verrucomicrobiales bacterium]|jgi:phosphate transport system permease protein|nr:phosphate ABC transporter permease subunit PstC [Verrucomicrobiales bacterium]